MATVLNRPEQTTHKVILHDISWETYERLLTEHGEGTGTRFIYDRGTLEIMIVSLKHEKLKDIVIDLFTIIADARGMDFVKAGSTTFRCKALDRGFEPDGCFYTRNANSIRDKDEIDLTQDPPPDLVIEIDISSPSLPRFPVFAAVGIPEVWRHDNRQVSIHRLDKNTGSYLEIADSAALPGVTGEVLTRLTNAGITDKRSEWLRDVRAWTHEHARDSSVSQDGR